MKKSEATKRWGDASFVADAKATLERVLLEKDAAIAIDLRGIRIGLDGAPAGFEIADFQDVSLEDADSSFARFSCSFSRANFRSSNFIQAVFDACRFKEAKFSKCDFSEARLDSPTLDDAVFIECVFLKTWIGGRRANEYGGRRVTFRDCDFTDAVFQNLQFRAVTFENCTFNRSVFKKCYLAGVSLNGNPIGDEVFEDCQIQSVSVNGEPLS